MCRRESSKNLNKKKMLETLSVRENWTEPLGLEMEDSASEDEQDSVQAM